MALPAGFEVASKKLAAAPIWFLPIALLPGSSIEAGAEWTRAVFDNGRHRIIDTARLGAHDQWRISEGLMRFDQWTRVGRLLAIVAFNMREGQAHTEELMKRPVVAVARLSSVVGDDQYEGQAFSLQRWVNLGPEVWCRG